jgi:fatty-acyl-CoA synthase
MQVTLPLTVNAKRLGVKTAIEGGNCTLSWAGLADLVARFAAILRCHGILAGDRVAILAENSELHLAAFFAIPWCGAILVEINLRLSPVEIAELIDHSGAKIVLHDRTRVGLLTDALSRTIQRSRAIELSGGPESIDALIASTTPMADAQRCGEETASIFYTGGTTGRSKGAMLSHNNHMFNGLAMWAELAGIDGDVRYLHAPPMFHA